MITKQQLSELEGVIRDLVPELVKKWKKHTCGIMVGYCSPECEKEERETKHPITLEHCREALSRKLSGAVKGNGVNDCISCFSEHWQDLQPWESQDEAHEFLYQYLVTKNK
jgi:hypothetical protein